MSESKVYKLNKQRQAGSAEGMFKYYFYDNGVLMVAEVEEEKFDKLIELDSAYYNSDRREKDHKVTKFEASPHRKKFCATSVNDLSDKEQLFSFEDMEDNADFEKSLSVLSAVDREIYRLCVEKECTQTEAAEALGKTQSHIAKHLAKINKQIEEASFQDI